MEFELLASSLRADQGDLSAFTEALAAKLEGALPAETVVERKGGGFFSGGPKKVESIAVQIGETRYELKLSRGSLHCTRGRAVRGIVLKTEVIGLDEWIDALSRDLSELAGRSERARLALERLVGP